MSEIEKIDEENNVTTADAAVEEPASSNNGGDSGGPDTDLEGWFLRHKIPYTDGVQISLDDWGVQCVEQLKLLPSDVFLGMYEAEKLVVRETAKIVLQILKDEGPVDLSKCVVGQVASASAKFRNTKHGDVACSNNNGKLSPKKIPRNVKHALEARQAEGHNPDPALDLIVKLWSTTGHQNNLLRINVCNALRDGCTKAKIARAVRTRVFGPWDGVGKSDATYKKIKSTLLRIHNDMRNGKFDSLSGVKNNEEYQKVLSSKSVKLGARGRKEVTKVEVRSDANSTKPDDLAAPDLPSLNANEL